MPIQSAWSRFLVEGFVIVASILLAFAIDAAWDQRQSDARRQELIHGLILDFESLAARSEAAFEHAEGLARQNRALLELIASGGSADITELNELMGSFFANPGRLRTTLPVLGSAIGSDGLGSIRDPGFLQALADFQYQMDGYNRSAEISGDLYFMEFAPYFRQKFGSAAVVVGNPESNGEWRYPYPPGFELTLDEIIAEIEKPESYGRLEHISNVNSNARNWIAGVGRSASEVAQALRRLE